MSSSTTTPCTNCVELEAQLERVKIGVEIDMAALAQQVARMQQENDRLSNRLADRGKETSKRDHEAYKLWLEVHKKKPEVKANAFGPAAQAALTRARRAGLDQDDILKIIRIHARYRFLNYGTWDATDGMRKDKLSDAFKDEDRWGKLLELADRPPLPSPRSKTRGPDYISYGYPRPLHNLIAALEANNLSPYVASGQGSARCPIHDDREKSFRFREDDKGGVLMYCHVCSSHFVTGEAFCDQVRQNLELPLQDIYPKRKAA